MNLKTFLLTGGKHCINAPQHSDKLKIEANKDFFALVNIVFSPLLHCKIFFGICPLKDKKPSH